MKSITFKITSRFMFGVIIILTFFTGVSQADVTLVEPGHTLNQIVDSAVPLTPSQAILDDFNGGIESIGCDSATGTLFIQTTIHLVRL